MKSKLGRPFRAPRNAVVRSNKGKGAEQLGAAEEQPPNDIVQSDSEEATHLGLVWKPVVVKETQYPDEGGEMPLGMVEPLGVQRTSFAQVTPSERVEIDNGGSLTGKGTTVVAASPNLAEFETFLESLGVEHSALVPVPQRSDGGTDPGGSDKGKGITPMAAKKKKKAPKKKKAIRKVNNKEDSDESEDLETFGDIHLRALSKRPALAQVSSSLRPPDADEHSVTVAVEDILFEDRSTTADVPDVSTLPSPQPKRKERIKAQVKWTYETVLEPTGVASKYWDADAPAERATKRLAKEKLVALTLAEADTITNGMSTCLSFSIHLAISCLDCFSFINY